MIERRKEKRKKEGHKVTIELASDETVSSAKKFSFTLTDDISLSGIKVISDKLFPIDSLVNIELSLSSINKIINMTGKVRWVNRIEDDLHEIGMEFEDISKDNIRVLIEYLYQ